MTDGPLLEPSALLAVPNLTLAVAGPSIRALAPSAQVLVAANLVLRGQLSRDVLGGIIALGLVAGGEEVELLEGDVRARLDESRGDWEDYTTPEVLEQVADIASDTQRARVISALAVLNDARRRMESYDSFYPVPEEDTSTIAEDMAVDLDDDPWGDAEDDDDEDVPPILDDPWGETESLPEDPQAAPKPTKSLPTAPPIEPAAFVLESLVLSALKFATGGHLPALRVTCQRHASVLWPYRVSLVEAVPGWASPGDEDLLPLLFADDDGEAQWPKGITERPAMTLLDHISPTFGIAALRPAEALLPVRRDTKLSSEEITQWYTARVLALDDLGLIDAQLAWVQHATALGVTGLDAIGEELSLLSRLIYEANLNPDQLEHWSLATWREAPEEDIVRAYTANSTAASIVDDLRRLVMPYLYVLESRAERSGKADPELVQRMLHDAILDQPLNLALPCFQASTATLPSSARLVKEDQTVARLALAVLYGSDAQDAWPTMSAIFECLPVWDVSGGDADTDREATETTLDSIAAFVRPTTMSDGAHGPRDLFVFFHPLPFASLSRALDILDVHLESGEILSRYSVRVYLRTLLQSARNRDEQVTLAEQMVRRCTARGDERKWMKLWEDMCRLQGGNDTLLRGAFGMLGKEEMMRIFLGGLLSSGFFAVAKKVVRRLEPEGFFTPQDLENAVLTTSKEFYMRAETGNIHTGDMKQAYECLSVAPATDAIRAEQDFIQATSRITSFRSPALASLTPAEIRHTKNKLDLIAQVLSSSDDAYKHTAIVLELTDKLGYKNDTAARAQVLAMMCDAAIAERDWKIAKERVDEMVAVVKPDTGDAHGADMQKVRDVTYRACLKLGTSAYPDAVDRLALLAQAVALCPADQVPEILPLWRDVQDTLSSSPEAIHAHAVALTRGAAPTEHPVDRMLGSRTAARAAKWGLDNLSSLRSFTATPLSRQMSRDLSRVDSRGSVGSGRASAEGSRPSAAALFDDDPRAGARRALVKGVGWLLGAEEGDV